MRARNCIVVSRQRGAVENSCRAMSPCVYCKLKKCDGLSFVQLFPDICNWKPKTKGITLRKFCIFCLIVPDIMTVEIRPSDIEILYDKSLKAAEDRARNRFLLQLALDQQKMEEGLSVEEKEALRKKRKTPAAPTTFAKRTMDAEVFIDFALPMVRTVCSSACFRT